MATVQLPSGTIDYDVIGPADSPQPPVLFIHGVAIDNRLWRPAAELLAAKGFRCYLPILPLGAHRIPWGADHDRSVRGAASLIREFVAEFGLSDATLVANDTGGALTQYALDADPNLVGRVVFTNCDAFDLFPPQPFRLIFGLLKSPAVTKAMIAGPLQLAPVRHSMLGVGLLTHNRDADFTRDVFEPLRTDARIRDDLSAFLRTIDPKDLARVTPRMSRVTAPVSFVWGIQDKCFTPRHGRRFAAVFGDVPFTEVPDSLTFVGLDRPDAVADAVTAAQQSSR